MLGKRRITMARLAERFAAHLGNSQTTTQDPNPVLQPLLDRQVQNTMAGNDYLPFVPNQDTYRNVDPSGSWWDRAGVGDGNAPSQTAGNAGTSIQSLLQALLGGSGGNTGLQGLDGGMAKASGGTVRDPRNPNPEDNTPNDPRNPRRPQGRVTAVPFNEVPGGGDGNWVPQLPASEYTPGTGFLDFKPQQVAPASSLENWAAGNVTDLWRRPTESLQARDSLGNLNKVMNGNIGDVLSAQSSTDALDKVSQMFDQYIQPTVGNQAALMGLDRGTGETNAIGAAKAQYMLPTMQQLLQLEDAGRSRNASTLLGQSAGYANLGTSQDARQTNAINEAMQIGGTGRGIANQVGAANQAEISRLASAAENMSQGALGMVPTSVGSTASAKPGLISTVFS